MEENKQTFWIVLLILTVILGIGGGMIYLANTNNQEKTQMTEQTNTKTADAEKDLKLTDRTVVMETNFGTLHIEMLDKAAPKTAENFIRLSFRKYFDGITFHRMVQVPGFSIIQGGDPKGNGTGGQSAFGRDFDDEIMKKGSTTELIAPELYFNEAKTAVVYKKGYLAMANRGANTNGSQFFIMLGDTMLDAKYTIFGKIAESDFAVLDKIKSEVKPSGSTGDGKPSREIKIVSAKLAE
jgi:cyclophilin family peptidyl-prolyl cis-trans isomerase